MKFTFTIVLLLATTNLIFCLNPFQSILSKFNRSNNDNPNQINVQANASINHNNGVTNLRSTDNVPDPVYDRIKKEIFTFAETLSNSPDLNKKKKLYGVVSEGTPEGIRLKAEAMRKDKMLWLKNLGYPTSLYRICLVPISKANYQKWCRASFFSSQKKKDGNLIFNK